jgi:hypothetical protein
MSGIYTAPEIVKMAIKEFYDKLTSQSDFEKFDELDEADKRIIQDHQNGKIEMCSQEENDAINKQLGLYV